MSRTLTVNWMDWMTLAIVLVSVLRGARRGVLAGVLDVAVLVAAFLSAAVLYSEGAAVLRSHLSVLPSQWAAFLAFLIIWFGLYLPVGMLVRWALGGEAVPASRMMGGVLGILYGLVLVTALLVVTLAAPFHRVVAVDAGRSRVAPYLLRANDRALGLLRPVLPLRVPRIGPGGKSF